MDMKIAARMIAVFAIGMGLTAAISASRHGEDWPDAHAPRIEHPGGDPTSGGELARCRDIGIAALKDVGCHNAWAQNRRRFLQLNERDELAPPRMDANGGRGRP